MLIQFFTPHRLYPAFPPHSIPPRQGCHLHHYNHVEVEYIYIHISCFAPTTLSFCRH